MGSSEMMVIHDDFQCGEYFFLTCVCYIIAIIVDTTLESIGI